MTNKKTLKGVVFVALGATSYGMLATFVKLAYQENYTTAEVTTSQFVLGLLGLLLVNLFQKMNAKTAVENATSNNIFQLIDRKSVV